MNREIVSVPHVAALDGHSMRQALFGQLQAPDLARCLIAVYRYNDFDMLSGKLNVSTSTGLVRTLERAAIRGVEVTIVTRDPFSNDEAVAADTIRLWYRGLKRLAESGAQVKVHESLHAKVYLCEAADRKFFAVGSSNLTMQGMGFRWAECNVRGYHPGEYEVVEREVRRILADRRVKSLDEWARELVKTPRGLLIKAAQ